MEALSFQFVQAVPINENNKLKCHSRCKHVTKKRDRNLSSTQ